MPTNHGAHGNNFKCRNRPAVAAPVFFVGSLIRFNFSKMQGEPELCPVS